MQPYGAVGSAAVRAPLVVQHGGIIAVVKVWLWWRWKGCVELCVALAAAAAAAVVTITARDLQQSVLFVASRASWCTRGVSVCTRKQSGQLGIILPHNILLAEQQHDLSSHASSSPHAAAHCVALMLKT